MDIIEIKKPSSRVLSKMKKGMPCRICSGSGMRIMVDRKRSRPINSAFRKGKAITISFSPMELEQNMGRGLFDDIGGAFKQVGEVINYLPSKAYEAAKPTLDPVIDKLTPYAQDLGDVALDKFAEVAPELGSKALTALALYSGNPALVPYADVIGREGGRELGNVARNEGKKAIQKSRRGRGEKMEEPMESIDTMEMVPRRRRRMSEPERRRMEPMEMAEMATKNLSDYTTDELTQEISRRQSYQITPLDRSGNTQVRDPRVRPVGSGMYAGGLYASMGRGMSSVQGKNTVLSKSPMSSPNFIMASNMPPAYAELMRS
jgi:hypothetical protein